MYMYTCLMYWVACCAMLRCSQVSVQVHSRNQFGCACCSRRLDHLQTMWHEAVPSEVSPLQQFQLACLHVLLPVANLCWCTWTCQRCSNIGVCQVVGGDHCQVGVVLTGAALCRATQYSGAQCCHTSLKVSIGLYQGGLKV